VKSEDESATGLRRPLIDIPTSAEVRWFFEGSLLPGVNEWFSVGHLLSKSESRDDQYLVFPASTSVGVKFRDGNLEIKPLVKTLGVREFPASVAGHVQVWEKWSYGDKESKPLLLQLQQMLTKDTKVWITVKKERRLRKYSMDTDKVLEVNPELRPRNGCNVELTKINLNGLSYWSVSLGVPEVNMRPQDTDDELQPEGVLEIRQHLPAELGSVLFEFQFPADAILLPVESFLCLHLEALVVDPEERLTLPAAEIDSVAGRGPLMDQP
jgi:hypothetical protein